MTGSPPAGNRLRVSVPRTLSVRRLLRAVFALGTLALVAFLLRDMLFGPEVAVREAMRGPVVQTVVASGRVMTPQRVSIASVITAGVVRIPVDEGQTVRRGDVLIVLDDKDIRAALAESRAAVEGAAAKLVQLRDVALPAAQQSLVQAQANLVLARQQWQRAQDLTAKGFVSRSALDDARRNLDVAESQLRAAQLQVESNTPSGSDYRLAQAALTQARANVALAEARLEQTVIRAAVDGTLIARNVEPGNVAQPGKELMVLAPSGETQIVVDIDEKNLSQLRLGQKAIGSADAYPKERFEAELFYINPGIDALRGSVETKLRVPKPPAYLRQDMTVSVDIEVGRRADAVTIPSDAVYDMSSDASWVLVVVNGRAEKRAVKLGLRGEGRVEVLAGIAPGDFVVPTSANIRPGQRVRTDAVARTRS